MAAMWDVVVVGAGICGLQLGALLASDGRRVLVLEKLNHVGGRAFLWEKDGFVVDNGIHLIRFGPKSATAQVFRHLGKPLEFVDLKKSYAAFPGGDIVDFPTSPAGFLNTKMMSLGERLKTLGLMVRLKLGRLDGNKLLDTSVETWLDQEGVSGGMRRYLQLVSGSMQVCPFIERSSAGEMLLNIQNVLKKGHSVMYPARGWRYIYDTLQAQIEELGEIRTTAEVQRVLVQDGRACGVELASGEQIEAAQVVVSLPCQQLFEVLDESLVPESFAQRCKTLRPTAGVSIDYGLKRPISEDGGLWYLFEPMSFGMFTSNLCPEQAPAGKQLLTWFAPADLDDMCDKQTADGHEQALERAIFKLFPALPDAIEWRRAMQLRMVDGVEVNITQHRHKRPEMAVPKVDELFLVGDSLAADGAGGDVGHEAVLKCYQVMTGCSV